MVDRREQISHIAAKRLSDVFLAGEKTPEQLLEEKYPVYFWEMPQQIRRRAFRPNKIEPARKMAFIDSRPYNVNSHMPTVIVFPGIFSSVQSLRIDAAAIDTTGARTLIVDYASLGNPDTFVKEFPNFLKDQRVEGSIILYGTSLGGVVAQYMSLYGGVEDRIKGMILSHTAHLASKQNFANLLTRGAGVIQVVERPFKWELIKSIVNWTSNKNGLRKFTPGEDLHPLDKQIAHMLVAQSDADYQALERERAQGFANFLLKATKSTRWPHRKMEIKSSPIPTLWIYAKKDPTMHPESHERLQQLYPQVIIESYPSDYEHHNHSFRRGTILTEHIVPFINTLITK